MNKGVDLGKIIVNIREKRKIKQPELCRKLCPVYALSRIENEEKDPSYFLLEALLQRLGKSIDKFELVLSMGEYAVMKVREEIEDALEEKTYEKVRTLLELYEKSKKSDLSLHQQYVQKIRAILIVQEKGDWEKGIACLKNAISETMDKDFEKNKFPNLLTLEEIRLLFMLADWYFNLGKTKNSEELLYKLVKVIEKNITDEEDKVKVFPVALYLLARTYLKKGAYEDAGNLCERGILCLTQNGMLPWLAELLQLQITIQEKLHKRSGLLEKRKNELQALLEVYEEFGDQKIPMSSLLKSGVQKELWLSHELIRNGRLAKDLSREMLCSGICEPESLARIEAGIQHPSRFTFHAISEKLGIRMRKFHTPIETENFELHELRREMDKLLSFKRHEEAKVLYFQLEQSLDQKSALNQQYLLFVDTVLRYQSKEITINQAIERQKKAYFLTAIKEDILVQIKQVLTRQETYILNQIATLYYLNGEKETSIMLYKNVFNVYQGSGIDVKHYSRILSLTIFNLAGVLEEFGNYSESIRLLREGIQSILLDGRGNILGMFLGNYAHTLECMKEKRRKICEKYFLKACQLSYLFHDKISHKTFLEHHIKEYGEIT